MEKGAGGLVEEAVVVFVDRSTLEVEFGVGFVLRF